MTRQEKINSMQKSVMAIFAGVVISLFSFYLARKANANDNMKEALDLKADKIELEKEINNRKESEANHQIQHKLEMDKVETIKDHVDVRFDDLFKRLELEGK